MAVFDVALVAAWLAYRSGSSDRRRFLTFRIMNTLGQAIEQYYQKEKQWPSVLDDLPESDKEMIRYYKEKEIVDGWGNGFLYEKEDEHFTITSLGRDGAYGGIGLDHDITNHNHSPPDALPTLYQFYFQMPTEGMVVSCALSGGIAFLISILTLSRKKNDAQASSYPIFGIMMTVLFAAIFGVLLSILHIPIVSGH